MNVALKNETGPAGGSRTSSIAPRELDEAIERRAARAARRAAGRRPFRFRARGGCTIPAEYILFRHFLGDPPIAGAGSEDRRLSARARQAAHDGWPLFTDGAFNISASVKAYFALKMIGDSPDAPHMRRARAAILAQAGGAAHANVFTRSPARPLWRAALARRAGHAGRDHASAALVSVPSQQDFLLGRAPCLCRCSCSWRLKPRARNPRGVRIDELFVGRRTRSGSWPGAPHQKQPWTAIFARHRQCSARGRSPISRARSRKRAIDKAVAFVTERLNGEDGLGAIYPAMANSVLMYRRARRSRLRSATSSQARAAIEQASCRQGGRGLLPALRVAGVGHGARLPCADGEPATTLERSDRRGGARRSTG